MRPIKTKAMNKKYEYIKKTINSFEHIAAFPSPAGVYTLEELYNWESADIGNRRFYVTSNYKMAIAILNNTK